MISHETVMDEKQRIEQPSEDSWLHTVVIPYLKMTPCVLIGFFGCNIIGMALSEGTGIPHFFASCFMLFIGGASMVSVLKKAENDAVKPHRREEEKHRMFLREKNLINEFETECRKNPYYWD